MHSSVEVLGAEGALGELQTASKNHYVKAFGTVDWRGKFFLPGKLPLPATEIYLVFLLVKNEDHSLTSNASAWKWLQVVDNYLTLGNVISWYVPTNCFCLAFCLHKFV